MTNIAIGAVWRPYLRALAESGFDVACVGAWVVAGELPPARRRTARGALVAVTVATAIPGIRAARSAAGTTEPPTPGAGSGLPFVDVGITLPAEELTADVTRRRVVLAGAVGVAVLTTAVAVSAGAAAAGRRLERRWLARLVRHGHPQPHRALAVRMAALYGVMVLPSRLIIVWNEREAGRRVPGDDTATG